MAITKNKKLYNSSMACGAVIEQKKEDFLSLDQIKQEFLKDEKPLMACIVEKEKEEKDIIMYTSQPLEVVAQKMKKVLQDDTSFSEHELKVLSSSEEFVVDMIAEEDVITDHETNQKNKDVILEFLDSVEDVQTETETETTPFMLDMGLDRREPETEEDIETEISSKKLQKKIKPLKKLKK